ncbi:MAG: hypothetical protein ACRELB_16410, partial [Polyangiaceae bacterium]
MRLARVFLALIALTLLVACGGGAEPGVMLSSWTLEAQGVERPLTLPAHFDRLLGDHPGVYALRTDVRVPPELRGRELTLTIPYFAALVSLEVDGHLLPDLDAGALDRYRGTGPHRFIVPPVTGAGPLHLELVVDHRWTGSAWLDTVPRLSPGTAGDRGYVFVKLFNESSAAAGLAMILLVGFANGIVYLSDRRRGAYGWMTLASFFGAFYAAFSLGLTEPVFGAYDPTVMGGAVVLSGLSTVRFTSIIFGRRHARAFWGFFVVWAIAATWNYGPFRSTRYLTPITVMTTIVAGGYCVMLLVQELRKGRPPLANVLATIGWPLVCVLAIDDFASWLGLGELYHGVRGASLGVAVLSALQAAALGAQLLQSLRQSDLLNAELAGRVDALEKTNAEVRSLNEELR